MKKSILVLTLAAVLSASAAPLRITGFEESDGRWKNAHGRSGNAVFSRVSAADLPEGKNALAITFGGKENPASRKYQWGNVSVILQRRPIPANAKVIRFWVKGKNTKGFGIIIRLGDFIHIGTQNDKKAWIDFADGEWFQYECALKDFVPAKAKDKGAVLKSFKGINYITFSAVADWRIKAADRQPQKLYIDWIEVE